MAESGDVETAARRLTPIVGRTRLTGGPRRIRPISRRDEIFGELRDRHHRQTDRLFGTLLVGQWVFAFGLAFAIARDTNLPLHLKLALVVGGFANLAALALIGLRPGWWGTRQVITVVQLLWSALLITMTDGRSATHLHVFGSLAFLACYRDWKLLPTAITVVIGDVVFRGAVLPDSLYGAANGELWGWLERLGWVLFEALVLGYACIRGVADLRAAADREARIERVAKVIERKVDERTTELHENMERYRALVETTAAIPFELDAKTLEVLYVAPQLTRMFECEAADLWDGEPFPELCHSDDIQRVRDAILAFVRGKRPAADPLDFRLVAKSGRTMWVRTFLSSCEHRQIRGLMIDVTRQRKLESELHQAQKLESVGRLAAGVAHEINTPVQFVSDSVQFLRDSVADLIGIVHKQQAVVTSVFEHDATSPLALDAMTAVSAADLPYLCEEMPKALERAADGLDRVAVIVRSMKVFAHPGGVSGVDLNAAIESTLTIARNEYRYVADVETSYGPLPKVVCHAGEINQVILNVVLNAAHAIGDVVHATGGRGLITVRTRRDDDHVIISIGDSGGGIPEHAREHIFDPFFTTKQVGKGTGQGLAIARAVIVEKHRGGLTYDTQTGAGTTFHIRLPIQSQERGLTA